jgi:hypothetical protein
VRVFIWLGEVRLAAFLARWQFSFIYSFISFEIHWRYFFFHCARVLSSPDDAWSASSI